MYGRTVQDLQPAFDPEMFFWGWMLDLQLS
jgi:hypothetical protein